MADPLTPEQYAQLLALGQRNAELGVDVDAQNQRAAVLRRMAPNMAPVRDAGRFKVFNPLEALASTAANVQAMKGDQQARALQMQQVGNTNQQNQMIMAALLRGRGNLMQQPQGPQDPYANLMISGT